LLDRAYGKAKQPGETDEVTQSFSFLHLTAARPFSEQLRAELVAAASTTIAMPRRPANRTGRWISSWRP